MTCARSTSGLTVRLIITAEVGAADGACAAGGAASVSTAKIAQTLMRRLPSTRVVYTTKCAAVNVDWPPLRLASESNVPAYRARKRAWPGAASPKWKTTSTRGLRLHRTTFRETPGQPCSPGAGRLVPTGRRRQPAGESPDRVEGGGKR